jgi:hypothetical protein
MKSIVGLYLNQIGSNMKSIYCSILFFFFGGSVLFAQLGDEVLLEKHLYAGEVILEDLDLDGDLDMVAMNTDVNLILDGLSVVLYEEGTTPERDYYSFICDDIFLGEINGDGYPDIVLRYQPFGSPFLYYGFMLNNGDGSFTDPIEIDEFNGSGIPQLMALGNINGDPYPDLVINNPLSNPQNFYYMGVTNGFLSNPIALGTPRHQFLIDLNDDGLLDKIYATGNTNVSIQFGELLKFALNDGDGNFIDSPIELNPQSVGATGNWNLTARDMNGDGMPEILIGSTNRVILTSTLGDLNYSDASDYAIVNGNFELDHLVGADFNGNGTPDRLRAKTLVGDTIGTNIKYREVGFDVFDNILSENPILVDSIFVEGNTNYVHQDALPKISTVGDINNDGVLDLVIGNQGLGLKMGLENFEFDELDWLVTAPEIGWQGERKLVQLDGNALADWMAFGEGSLFQATYNVDGTQGEMVDLVFDVLPAFGEHLLVQFEFMDVLGGAAKELLLFSSPDEVNVDLWIYSQSAPATFELVDHQTSVIPGIDQYLSGIYSRFSVKEVDVDNDGDLDISFYQRGASTNSSGSLFVLKNTDGVFTPHQTLSNFGFSNYTGSPQWIDLTGDGFPEIATSSTSNMGLMIHPNTDGMITPTNAPSASFVSTVYPVSLNDDNLMDLIVHSYNTPVRKWINLGNLEFDVIDIGTSVPSLNGVVDINNDGELDLLSNGLTYMGQGNGEFQSVAIDMVPASFLSFSQAIPIYGDYNFLPDLFYGDLYEFSYYPNLSQDLTPPLEACPEDLNGDGITNVGDLVLFIQALPCYGTCISDFNQDFITDVADLQQFLEAYGLSCE